MTDTKYNASTVGGGPDNIMGDDNNYETVTGAISKVGRVVASEWKDINGESFGNRAWKALEREQDTPANRQLLVHYTMQALQPLIDSGDIADVEITHDDPTYLTGAAMLIRYTDVRSGDTSTDGFIAPWGKM